MIQNLGMVLSRTVYIERYIMSHTQMIADMVAASSTRDDIIVALHGDGLTLNKSMKLYADYAREHGLTTATVSRKPEALTYLAGACTDEAGWTAECIRDAVIDLQAEFDVAESTARDYCRAYTELMQWTYPVTDPRTAMFEYLIEHAGDEYEELKVSFKLYATEELGRSASNVNEYWKGYDLHLALTAAAV
jgi:hypothetical protein